MHACQDINLRDRCFINDPLCPSLIHFQGMTSPLPYSAYNSISHGNQWTKEISPSPTNIFANTEQKVSHSEKIESSMQNAFQEQGILSGKVTPSWEPNVTSLSTPQESLITNSPSTPNSFSVRMQTSSSAMQMPMSSSILKLNTSQKENVTNHICYIFNDSRSTNDSKITQGYDLSSVILIVIVALVIFIILQIIVYKVYKKMKNPKKGIILREICILL